jgi:opacity protein-like surface antigen
LSVRDGGERRGWLVGLDRQLGENFKVGVGYNFTDFSDDLTDLEYDNHGWFLNLAGFY